MRKTPQEISRMFAGKLVGTKVMKKFVSRTLTILPDDILRYVTKNCWFIGSMDDAWAFAFTGNDLKNQHLIFLSDDLFQQHADQIRYTIVHEIGHVMLKHRNATLSPQTKSEIRQQEKAADVFAKTLLMRKK